MQLSGCSRRLGHSKRPPLHTCMRFEASSRVSADRQKHTLLSQFHCLGIPIDPAKLEGPATCLTFLYITVALQLLLPTEQSSWNLLPTTVHPPLLCQGQTWNILPGFYSLHLRSLQLRWFTRVGHS